MNRVVHFEIHAADREKIKKFYSDVFGWEMTQMGPETGNYVSVVTGKDESVTRWPGINGGITQRPGPLPDPESKVVNAFVCTITVADIDASLEKIKNAGGSMAADKVQVPGVGWLAYCKDPELNVFGVLQPEVPQS